MSQSTEKHVRKKEDQTQKRKIERGRLMGVIANPDHSKRQ